MSPLSSLANLRPAWGRGFHAFGAWPLELEGLPRTHEELRETLKTAPKSALEFLEAGQPPRDKMLLLPLAGHWIQNGETLSASSVISVRAPGCARSWCTG